jgi:ATP-dependent Clp protease ATP-binding subunit ClpC
MKPSFRVFLTEHDGGKLVGVLMRRRARLFAPPAPAAWGDTVDEVLAALEPALVAAAADGDLDLYRFTEELGLRRVAIELRPRVAAEGTWVIGSRVVPLRVAFAAYDDGPVVRVLVPRFGWSLALEALDDAAEVIRAAVAAAVLGTAPHDVLDLRAGVREWIEPWAPARFAADDDRDDDAADPPPPTVAAVADDWTGKLRRRQLAPPVGELAAATSVVAAVDAVPPRSVLLVGEPGVGKSALVRRLAKHLGDGPRRRRLWATSAAHLTAGMTYLGMWQERCLAVARELGGTDDWLFVDRLAELAAAQGDGSSIAELWLPAVVAGELRLIAECSPSELARLRRRHPALVDAFAVVRLDEPGPDEVAPIALAYLRRKRPEVELHPAAVRRLLALCAGFRRDQRFPGKALALLDWWCQDASPPPTMVLPRDVTAAFARWSGLPVELVADDRPIGAAAIAEALAAGVVGQDHACAVVARALVRFRVGLDDPERPVASLLFVGPTGVGKTELAKQIARYLFGDGERLIRIDLSEYMTPGSATRLLEVGAGGTSLVEAVRRQPLAVILLDELEKAHPEVFDLLLAVLGEGRLTDALGRLVDLRMCVIVMTSNLGVTRGGGVGFAGAAEPDYAAAVRAHFRPEFTARLDHVVGFHRLRAAAIEQIVDLELAKLRTRPGMLGRGLTLWASPAARATLAARGVDPVLGARPLRRLLEEVVVAPLAVRMAADPGLRDRAIGIVTADEAPRADPGLTVIALPG